MRLASGEGEAEIDGRWASGLPWMNAVEIRSSWRPAEAEEPLSHVRNAAEWFGSRGSGAVPLPSGPMALAQEVARGYGRGIGSLRNPVPSVAAEVEAGQPEGEEVTAMERTEGGESPGARAESVSEVR